MTIFTPTGFPADVYFLIINASRIEADVAWLQAQAAKFSGGELKLTDASHQLRRHGRARPAREGVHQRRAFPARPIPAMRVNAVTDLKKNQIGGFQFEHHSVLVSRTGYTGEDGFEIVGRDEAIRHALGQNSRRRPAVRHQALRPRRARHAAHGSLLSALRPRTGRGHHAHRSRRRIFRLARQRRIQRPRRSRRNKRRTA